jgi:hypothetical protein
MEEGRLRRAPVLLIDTRLDSWVRRYPDSSELCAIPALIGAGCAAAATAFGYQGTLPALSAAAVCFVIRMIGVRFDLNAPRPAWNPLGGRDIRPMLSRCSRILQLTFRSRCKWKCSSVRFPSLKRDGGEDAIVGAPCDSE